MTKSNEQAPRYTRPETRIEQFVADIAKREQVVVGACLADLRHPTEAVMGPNTAKGATVWIALADDEDMKDASEGTDWAIHHIAVDPFTSSLDPVQAMTLAIEKLTAARDKLDRLQRLAASDAA